MARSSKHLPRAALAVVMTSALGLAWYLRTILDDAYISLRYAKMAYEGHGLVYNTGQPVEGYTNFLWTLLLIPSHALPIAPEHYMYGLGFGCFLILMGLFAWFGKRVTQSPWGAVAGAMLIGLQWTTAQYATTGMETLAQTTLVSGAWVWWLTRARDNLDTLPKTMTILSILVALAGWTRMDSAVLLAPLGALCLWQLRQLSKTSGISAIIKPLMALAAPVTAMIGGWLLWKLSYYGHILPNTFWAKTAGQNMWMRGVLYVVLFFEASLFALPWFGVAAWCAIKKPWQAEDRDYSSWFALWAALGTWILYVIKVGGDFMDFRFMVPFWAVLTILILCWSATIKRGVQGAIAYAIIQLIAALIFYHTYENVAGIWTISTPANKKIDRIGDWVATGKHLHPLLHSLAPEIIIASNTAGGLPYYAQLRTVDMHGLADPWVAKHGDPFIPVPGHTVIAPFAYLQKKGVHLVFDIPLYLENPSDLSTLCTQAKREYYKLQSISKTDATFVFIPQPNKGHVVPVYLTRHSGLDALLQARQWVQVPVRRCFERQPEP